MYKKTLTGEWPFLSGVFSDLAEAKERISNSFFNPGVNIEELEKGYCISLMAPGLTKEDFVIKAENNILEISCKKKESEKNWIRKEWGIGEFSRKFQIKTDADQNGISAKYENGILAINVPKKKETISKNEIRVQ